MRKVLKFYLKRDFDVKISTLPKGEDRILMLQSLVKMSFDEIIKKAEKLLEYQTVITKHKECLMIQPKWQKLSVIL